MPAGIPGSYQKVHRRGQGPSGQGLRPQKAPQPRFRGYQGKGCREDHYFRLRWQGLIGFQHKNYGVSRLRYADFYYFRNEIICSPVIPARIEAITFIKSKTYYQACPPR